MAKKSAAQLKVVKPKEDTRSLDEILEDMKGPFIEQLKVQVQISDRVDAMTNVRELVRNWYGWDPWTDAVKLYNEVHRLIELSTDTYKMILDVFENLSIEDMKKENLDDFFTGSLPKADKIDGNLDHIEAYLAWLCIEPYANKLIQMHHLFQEEMEKRAE